jgi:hypothetical protein
MKGYSLVYFALLVSVPFISAEVGRNVGMILEEKVYSSAEKGEIVEKGHNYGGLIGLIAAGLMFYDSRKAFEE